MMLSTRAALLIVSTLTLVGCERAQTPAASPTTANAALQPVAGIQDVMAFMIDPAADFLWESVSTNVTEAGTEEKVPRTNEEWKAVRQHAILLTEGANLILMQGRRVAREGHQLEDHGTPGNLTAEQSEAAIKNDRAAFESFASALRDVGKSMLAAADTRNPEAIVNAGDTMDQVCEGCHLKFWYPGQQIPAFPNQAPEQK